MEVPLKPGVQLRGSAEDTALGWTQGHLCWGVRWAQHGWLGGYGCLPCPTVTPALHRLGFGGLRLAPLAVLNAGALAGAREDTSWGLHFRCRFAPVSVRLKLQREA